MRASVLLHRCTQEYHGPPSEYKGYLKSALAIGFQELSAKAIPPPPLQVAPLPAALTRAVVPAAPAPPRVYTVVDTNVVGPATIRQDLPSFSGRPSESPGVLEIVIDERGLVESATIREPVNASYDQLAVDATRNWRYQPTTLDGVPVKFRKRISIMVKPAT